MCCRRNKASVRFFVESYSFLLSTYCGAAAWSREKKRYTHTHMQSKWVLCFSELAVSNEIVVWTSCGHINNNSHSFISVLFARWPFMTALSANGKVFNLDKTVNNAFTVVFHRKFLINMLKNVWARPVPYLTFVYLCFGRFGLVGMGASFLSFVTVNIDVNYLVSKQIRCMQSH